METREIRLDPQDVLTHLHQLGFHDISPTQLHEFIRDLKKLIKYDMKKQKENTMRQGLSSCSSNVTSTSGSSQSFDQPDRVRQPLTQRRSSGNYVSTSSGSNASNSTECTSSSSTTDMSSTPEMQQKPIIKKPRPSFIRPRDLSAQTAPPRSDPVALYHYYQKFWQQFKQPGEDEHRELRWSIRERMLGGSSQASVPSRPASRASSTLHRL